MDLNLSMTFFSNWKYSVSNKIIGRLFICIQVVVLAVAFGNLFFAARVCYVVFSVRFTPTICIFTYFVFVFPLIFFAKKL